MQYDNYNMGSVLYRRRVPRRGTINGASASNGNKFHLSADAVVAAAYWSYANTGSIANANPQSHSDYLANPYSDCLVNPHSDA